MEGDTYQDLLDFESAYCHNISYDPLSEHEHSQVVVADKLNSPATENVLKETSTHIKDWGPFWNEDECVGIIRDPEKIINNEQLSPSINNRRNFAGIRQLTEDEIMANFAEQEEQFQLLRMQPQEQAAHATKTRPLSHVAGRAPTAGQAGLEHLGHLVCLMEQLSHLNEQNKKLRRTCVYLNDTQYLLQLQNKHLLKQPIRKDSRPRIRPRGNMASLKASKQNNKGYTSDSSDEECLSATEPRNKMKLAQRSLSVGSINVIDLDKSGSKTEKCKETKRLESVFSRSVLTSKWERVKKVFSGKPETPPKTEQTTITAEQLVRANSRQSSSVRHTSHHHHHHQHRTLTSSKSYDGGALLPFVGEDPYFKYYLNRSTDFTPQSPIHISSSVSDPPIPSVVTEPCEGTLMADSGLEMEGHGSSMGSSLLSEDCESHLHQYAGHPGSDDDHLHHSQYLSVVNHMRRRQSSPALSMQEEAMRHEQLARELSVPSPRLSRSASFRSNKAETNACSTPETQPAPASEESRRPRDKVRSTRSAWGRVKDIIHTRKDSLKRRNQRSHSAGDALPDGSMSDGEYFLKQDYTDEDTWDAESSTPQSSSPKRRMHPRGSTLAYSHPTSPERGRQPSPTSPEIATTQKPSHLPTQLDMPGLSGSLSEEFCKKLQDWEEKKKGVLTKEPSIYDLEYEQEQRRREEEEFSEEFIRKMEEWERIKGHKKPASSPSPAGDYASPDRGLPQSPSSQDHQLSESFTRKVKKWERVKTQRLKDSSSPSMDGGGGGLTRTSTEKRARKKDRSKSRDRERDRSRSKYDRQREKELKLIEKTQQKIEKEREKLGRMKKRLEEIETMGTAEVQGLSQEFARKLQEWEVKKGLRSDGEEIKIGRDRGVGDGCSPNNSPFPQRSATLKHSRSNSAKTYKEKVDRERTQSMCYLEGMDITDLPPDSPMFYTPRSSATRSSSVPLFPLAPVDGKDECTSIDLNLTSNTTPGQDECTSIDLNLTADKPRLLEGKDECTSIDLNLTTETTESLPELETQYKEELSQRDEEISGLQYEISQLTDRINDMSQQHQLQIEHYKRELWVSSHSGHYTIQSDLISANLGELREDLDKLHATHQHTDGATAELQGLLAQEVEAKMAAEQKVIENIGGREDPAPDQDASFDNLCNFLRKLHTQLGELRLGVGERDGLLRVLQQQLVCQEVNNRLLEVELQRRHMEVSYLREARRAGIMRRTKTFAGTDFIQRGECLSYGSTHHCPKASPHRMLSFEDPRNTLKYCTGTLEELDLAWLDEIQAHCNLLKAPPSNETHETQTEAAGALDTAVQTNLSLCAKIEAIRNSPSGQDSTLSRPGKREARTYFGSVSTPGIFPMPTPVKAPRVKHIAFGSTDLPARADRFPAMNPMPGDDVTYTFDITHSPESSKHSTLKSCPVSDSKNVQLNEITQIALPVDDCDLNGAKPPLTPVIRSRNPLKLKTEISATAATRTWKEGPPKRSYRHRKHSTENKPNVTDTDSKGKAGMAVSGETSEFKVVQDNSPSTSTKSSSPGSMDMLKPPAEKFARTPSPTNIRHRPLHRLKTADELLHESETLIHSRKHGFKSSGASTKLPNSSNESGSQGKENSIVNEIRKQFSRESSPSEYMNVVMDKLPQDCVRLAVRRLSSPTAEQYEFTPPLKDLTNDTGKVRKIKQGLLERLTPDKTVSSKGARISECPKEGTVSKHTELYENKNGSDGREKSTDSSKLSSPPQSSRPCERHDSKSSTKSSASTQSKSPSPVAKERKVHRLFQRKYGSAVVDDDSEEGAVSKLCRQIVSVEVNAEEEMATEEEGKGGQAAEEAQKKKTFNWLQKPKKFFKVSKC